MREPLKISLNILSCFVIMFKIRWVGGYLYPSLF